MFWRALLAFIAMPGMVAFALPIIWLWQTPALHVTHPLGLIVLTVGSTALLACVHNFYVQGKGTLAPWSPPRHLVTTGLYRHSRNPMYLSVLLVLVGWAITFASLSLLAYALLLGIAFHLRVIYGEEPWLAAQYGEHWQNYVQHVPRWLGR